MYKVYIVSKGDTINLIATKFRTTPEEIRQINGFPENYEVEFGQTIIVPTSKDNMFSKYIVKAGDTIYSIATNLGVNYKDLAALNGLDELEYIYPGQQIMVPNEKTVFYISKENDTLQNVANNLMVSQDKLITENATIYLFPDQLFVHQKE